MIRLQAWNKLIVSINFVKIYKRHEKNNLSIETNILVHDLKLSILTKLSEIGLKSGLGNYKWGNLIS